LGPKYSHHRIKSLENGGAIGTKEIKITAHIGSRITPITARKCAVSHGRIAVMICETPIQKSAVAHTISCGDFVIKYHLHFEPAN
jgi:hypothetical protein